MIALLLALIPLAKPAQDTEAPGPELVAAAVEELSDAFRKGDDDARIQAMRRHARVAHADVVEWVERGLRSQNEEVWRQAIQVLRALPHPAALDALHDTYRRDKKLRDDPYALTALIKAIGQHRNPDSIDLLADKFWEVQDNKVIEARAFSLAHIRSERSVKAIIAQMKSAGRQRIQPHMKVFRMSLMVLTGADQGVSQDLWMTWWNANKRGLEVSPEEPKLPREVATTWAVYWGRERPGGRPRKRKDRGSGD